MMKKLHFKKKPVIILLFLVIFLMFTLVAALLLPKTENVSCFNQTKVSENETINNHKEMRAVWVSFIDLSMKGTDYSERAFKEKFDKIVMDCKKLKMNALIVHVRPFSDALYESKYFPWSHIVARKQGQSPGYDPLKYMVEKAHNEGLEIHAWINPFRIQLNDLPGTLASNNLFFDFKTKEKTSVVDFGTSKYFNPCSRSVQNLIVDGVKEIVENYNVDGIHFDDYFYPESPKSPEKLNAENFDDSDYENYIKNLGDVSKILNKRQWRMENVNNLIRKVYKEIKEIKPNVVFGISPCCNNEVNFRIGADVYTWCGNEGYIDYICPQVYVSLDHPVLPFRKSADEWESIVKNKNIKLYYGLGIYKAGSKEYDKGTWGNSNDIIKTQIEYTRKLGCDGYMLFDHRSLISERSKEEVQNMMKAMD